MNGELLASDKARFSALKSAIDADLSDRRDWFARAEKNRTERFKRQNTAKPVALQDSPISKVIRRMARTACGLPANPEKKGFVTTNVAFHANSGIVIMRLGKPRPSKIRPTISR